MRRGLTTFLRDRSGNMAVEFALVAPIFILLLMGVIDYGIAAQEAAGLKAAARAGLQAVLNDSNDLAGAETAAYAVAPDAYVDVSQSCACSDGTSVSCSGTCAVGTVRKTVTVTVSEDLTLMVPWPGFDDPLPLEGVAKARVK